MKGWMLSDKAARQLAFHAQKIKCISSNLYYRAIESYQMKKIKF